MTLDILKSCNCYLIFENIDTYKNDTIFCLGFRCSIFKICTSIRNLTYVNISIISLSTALLIATSVY